MTTTAVSFRPVEPADDPLLRRIYSSTREEELNLTPWTAEQKAAFLKMQFDAQDRHYRQHYPQGQFLMILQGEVAAGRLYLDRSDREIRIIDIALLPEFRNRGTGTFILRQILEEAARDGKAVTIHVESNNPAMRFYERLGFRRLGLNGIYFLMEWRPLS